ncbi:U32 family peptidase [Suipraeoptans intestinalis]|uniref:peptidase U32 family protein n=2 Tax=Suipraeoptans intestinalis TaxID=2606628 RepID=UPI002A751139|nr:U32 family peptidase [Suipraeoptans intestinalis]MDY3122247.1 U32 family peptidase [Suipraeoptans intestinalis]
MGKHVEILAPAGSLDSLRAGLAAGADAVYIGGSRFGARAYAQNFTEEQLLEAIDEVHLQGKKIYMTVNTLLKDKELAELFSYLLPYYQRGLDAVIVQDMGVLRAVRSWFPGLEIHASTQMSISAAEGVRFLKKHGVSRVVPSRELHLKEIAEMKKEGLELECFVHGAMCYSYSGQCLFSSLIGGRSGNRGQCAQPCRLPYQIDGRPEQDLLSLKDLCTIHKIPELIEAGIDSFKIEGRMKQPEYVYTVTKLYKKYTDLYQKNGQSGFSVSAEDERKLKEVYQRRGYSQGYYHQRNGKEMLSLARPENVSTESQKKEGAYLPELLPVSGKLWLKSGCPASFSVAAGSAKVSCKGEVVQEAVRQPLELSKVEKQMKKTGSTGFYFQNLEICMEEGVFLPVQSLNQLRRQGLGKLTEALLQPYRREWTKENGKEDESALHPEQGAAAEENRDRSATYRVGVLVQTREQMKIAMDAEMVSRIYVEDPKLCREAKLSKKCIILALPSVFREDTAEKWEAYREEIRAYCDEVLIRNWDSLQWLRDRGFEKPVRTDYNLYVWNQQGKVFFREEGIRGYTAPVEFRERELKELEIEGATLIVYGRQPVMITANCVQKTVRGCDGRSGWLYLTDRKQKKIPVKKYCDSCYNVIYNPAPLFLADLAEDVKRLGMWEIRLDFSTEDKEEMQAVLKAYQAGFLQGDPELGAPFQKEFTRGHWKRGVK